jgi:monoamine oxidase
MNRREFSLLVKSLLAGTFWGSTRSSAFATQKAQRLVVIGAGLAGLAAARKLKGLGHDVVVLEARDRIGGRIHTSTKWSDFPLDLGASWIHGTVGNPLTSLAKQAGAALLTTRYSDSIGYNTDGSEWTAADEKQLDTLRTKVYDLLEVAQDGDADQTLRQALDELVGGSSPADRRKLVNFLLSSEMETEYSGGAGELSAHWFDDGTEYEGPDKLFAEGFRVIIDHLAAGLDILTGKMVTHIDWSRAEVKVSTRAGHFTADAVLVTLPLGVLKTDRPTFHPPLPVAKREAITKLGMGLLNKCYLRFPHAFWPQDVDWIEYIPAKHGEWVEWVSFRKAAGKPVLMGFLAAESAAEKESLADTEIVASAMSVLRTIYGASIPEPIDHQITRWAADPFSRGSYSFNAVHSTPAMRDALASPLNGRLFFAGEATERKQYGTAHGAYLSGLRAAEEMKASLL